MTNRLLLPALALVALMGRSVFSGRPWAGMDRGGLRVRIDATSNVWPKLTNSCSHWFDKTHGTTFNPAALRDSKPVAVPSTSQRSLLELTTAKRSMGLGTQRSKQYSWLAAMLVGWWSLAAFWAVRTWVCGSR